MHIHFDICHPSNVHYFRNTMSALKEKGHDITISARNKDVAHELLQSYGFDYTDRGKGSKNLIGKLFRYPFTNLKLLFQNMRNRPDLFVSFSSPYSAIVSSLLNRPHITLNDTEHTAQVHKKLTYPFSDLILTPDFYNGSLGKKHIRIHTVFEYFYLKNAIEHPDTSIRKQLNLENGRQYVVIRLVAWNSFHDFRKKVLNDQKLRQLIQMFETDYQVYINSESQLPHEFQKYQTHISSGRFHDLLANAAFVISEGVTTASESALLATPVFYVNSNPLMGYLQQAQKHGLLTHCPDEINLLTHIERMMKEGLVDKNEFSLSRNAMIQNYVNPTSFLVWLIENYPESRTIIQQNPDYQFNFNN